MIHIADGSSQERNKYAEIWSLSEYREAHSPGEQNVDRFMSVMKPKPGERIIDVGCGAGNAGLEFENRGLRSWWLDITAAGLDVGVDRSRFIEAPIWSQWGGEILPKWDYAFSC